MINYKKSHKAFSLIEVIFVLVILGIVSSIGSSVIVRVYESYIIQNALYKVNIKTELVANQIVNRLSYAIPNSTISKVTKENGSWNLGFRNSTGDSNNSETAEEGENWLPLNEIIPGTSNFTTIEWIGYDNDSFSVTNNPAWSGVANYDANTTSVNQLDTPASNLNLVSTIISNLSNNQVDLNNTTDSPAIFFQEKNNFYYGNKEYNPNCMGLINKNPAPCAFKVEKLDKDTFIFPDIKPKIITESYKLAWSAYALVTEPHKDKDGNKKSDIDSDGKNDLWDLYLYYNYQPWEIVGGVNEIYTDGKKSLLMKNISTFKFTKKGGIIQFKLCASSKIGQKHYITTCKEKAVLR
jgi:prepilin-type N-terminal cleavage/methylation domain-containing protein